MVACWDATAGAIQGEVVSVEAIVLWQQHSLCFVVMYPVLSAGESVANDGWASMTPPGAPSDEETDLKSPCIERRLPGNHVGLICEKILYSATPVKTSLWLQSQRSICNSLHQILHLTGSAVQRITQRGVLGTCEMEPRCSTPKLFAAIASCLPAWTILSHYSSVFVMLQGRQQFPGCWPSRWLR